MAKKSSSGPRGARKRGQHKPAKPVSKGRRSFTLANLQPPAGSRQRKVRVGRGMGSKLGKTAGSGNKGQKSRRGDSRGGVQRVGERKDYQGGRYVRGCSVDQNSQRTGMKRFIEAVKNMFRIEDLRNRVLFTLALLAVYRIGAHIPTPGINAAVLE